MGFEMKTAEFDELVGIMRNHEGFREEWYSAVKEQLKNLKVKERGTLVTKNILVEFYMQPSTTIVKDISVTGITSHVGVSVNGNAVWRGVAEEIGKRHGVKFGTDNRYCGSPCMGDHYGAKSYWEPDNRFKKNLKQEIGAVVSAERELYGKIEREIQRILG